jgi:(2Fe-2S) ferredoxin
MATLDILGRPAVVRRLVVCTGPCCNRLGQASAHLAALRALLVARGAAEESAGAASCVRRSCLGKCSGEPLAHAMPDDVWYRALSGESLLRIYQRHVVNGEAVAELVTAVPD